MCMLAITNFLYRDNADYRAANETVKESIAEYTAYLMSGPHLTGNPSEDSEGHENKMLRLNFAINHILLSDKAKEAREKLTSFQLKTKKIVRLTAISVGVAAISVAAAVFSSSFDKAQSNGGK